MVDHGRTGRRARGSFCKKYAASHRDATDDASHRPLARDPDDARVQHARIHRFDAFSSRARRRACRPRRIFDDFGARGRARDAGPTSGTSREHGRWVHGARAGRVRGRASEIFVGGEHGGDAGGGAHAHGVRLRRRGAARENFVRRGGGRDEFRGRGYVGDGDVEDEREGFESEKR